MKGRSCPGAAPSLHFGFAFLSYCSACFTPSGGTIFRCTFLPAVLLFQRPSGRHLSVFRIYRHSLFGRPSGGPCLVFYGFTGRAAYPTPFGDSIFRCTFFTNLSTKPTTSGGDIFLCVKKDIEERHAKGLQSRPLDSGFLYGGSEGRRASVLRVRPGAINAI